MGSSHSTNDTKSPTLSESHKSARNVLDVLAEDIKKQAENDAKKYASSLKGELWKASFKGAYGDWSLIESYGYSTPCYLNHIEHTNILYALANDRNPCLFSPVERFSNEGEAECDNNKIRGNEKKINGAGACAPYRRRHICDKNLEALTVQNTKNSDDLIGNISVTAKYEGESIVKNHPHKGTSDVCTALARSFADIGDIVRGRDMFKPNKDDKVQKGLREVFKNIHDKLQGEVKSHYADHDKSGNYFKLREDWWTANRDQVWKAITCRAPNEANYFTKESDGTLHFSSHGKCGHNEGDPPTNLDYVPQFLRWFDEWADDFCRIKKIKLGKVKEACRGKTDEKYCSLNGFDCTQTIWKKGIFGRGNGCTDCSFKCFPYEIWLGNQREAFRKQKEKYAKEIERYVLNKDKYDSIINNEYYGEFYKILKNNNYETVNKFINLLNEGKYCKKNLEKEEVIKFTNSGDKETFYRSEYCQVCPDCGVECTGGTCKPKEKDNDCETNDVYEPPRDATPTKINVLYSGNEQGDITKKLKGFCSNPTDYDGKNYEKWQCYYNHEKKNKCKMEQNSKKDKDKPKITKFHNFLELWVIYLLTETIRWNDKIKNCMNNTNITDCSDGCNKNCVCFDKWVKQKEQEWNSIKKLLRKKYNIPQQYYHNINNLFDFFFFPVMYKLKEEAKWNELTQELKKKMDFSKANNGTNDSQDAIKVLLDHLKEKATICKDNNTNEACTSSKKLKTNPCGDKRGAKHRTVKQIAQYYKRKAHAQLEERGGRSKLKGDASQGQYDRKGKADDFKTKLCQINENHSNADGNKSSNPCYGKNTERFYTGKDWSHLDKNQKSSYTDVYLPQRREHMCTSNLENLKMNSIGLKVDKVNNSFLGDVLLAAKYEADFIKKKYKRQKASNGFMDPATICRAMKYSFADIGDIIRGRDLWEHGDQTKLQGHLQIIFGKIKDTLKNKYTKEVSPYTQLRSDWWEANRDQVWDAMQCPPPPTTTKPAVINIKCGTDTPLMDYIPQRLRWMTEWAEWYCKEQSRLYGELVEKCNGCMSKGDDCRNNSAECKICKNACDAYGKNIKTWADQWDIISKNYEKLYKEVEIYAGNGGPGYYNTKVQEEDRSVFDFLYELHLQNGGKKGPPAATHPSKSVTTLVKRDTTVDTTPTVYSTAAGYVHQEMPIVGCKGQEVFCDNNGNKEKYAFKNPPPDYVTACGCNERLVPVPKKPEVPPVKEVDACDIVDTILSGNEQKENIDGCKQKHVKTYPYPPWKNDINLVEDTKTWMPPRRQKLCLHYLTENISGKEKLKEAFIKTAAAETFVSWNYYKSKNSADANQLERGIIPPEFLRSMFYTYADYRDICLNKDISKKATGSHVSIAKEKIDAYFKEYSDPYPTKWWDRNGPEIWKAMLCGLSHHISKKSLRKELIHNLNYTYPNVKLKGENTPTLEKFSERDQFLRWFTEWSDEFCRERQKKENEVERYCKKEYDGCEQKNKGDSCDKSCKLYKEYIAHEQKEYINQEQKFKEDKSKKKTEYEGYSERKASEYLKENCLDKSCSCMDKVTSITEYWNTPNKTYTNSNLEKRCECEPPPPPPAPAPKKEEEDACKIVEEVLSKTPHSITGGIDSCNPKDYGAPYPGWDCTNKNVKTEHNGACIPPRRIKLCVSGLTQTNNIINKEDIRKHFITCAAIETYFAWLRYKKINTEADKELKEGKIPDEFKRQMYYTFGDYRDIFFGTDISTHAHISEVSSKVITILEKENGTKSEDKQKFNNELLPEWWNEHGKEIWDGMLCALSYDTKNKKMDPEVQKNLIGNHTYTYSTIKFSGDKTTTLEEFAQRPQFLRWFIEWGEHFCREHKVEKGKLVKQCDSCGLDGTGKTCDGECGACKDQCKKYQDWLATWKGHYNKQKQRYTQVKSTSPYNNDTDVRNSPEAYQYLKKKLDKICPSGTTRVNCEYKCMYQRSSTDGMPASLDNEPEEVKGKCSCTPPPPPKSKPTGESLARILTTPRNGPTEEEEDSDESSSEDLDGGEDDDEDEDDANEETAEEEVEEEDAEGEVVEETVAEVTEAVPPQQEEPEPPAPEGVARILRGRTTNQDDEEEDEDEEDDDEESGSEEGAGEGDQDTTEVTGQGEGPKVEDICKIVKDALKIENLEKACPTKYGPKAPTSWKCVTPSGVTTTRSSGDTTERVRGKRSAEPRGSEPTGGKDGATGGLCIPPRRRKLYMHKVDDNVKDDASLRDWFVKSAAVETFFLWDRYKKIKEKEIAEKKKKENGALDFLPSASSSVGMALVPGAMQSGVQPTASPGHSNGLLPLQSPLSNSDDPENQLKRGDIPPDFLRLMFYTLGDYRDILYSGSNTSDNKHTSSSSNDNLKHIVLNAGGDKASMEKIQQEIDKILKQSGDKLVPKSSAQTPKDWWDEIAPSIWKGMICALTYKESGSGGEKKIEKNGEVYKKFFGDNNKGTPGTNTSTYKDNYQYNSVTLKDESSDTSPKGNEDTNNQPTKLSDFVEIPPFFRWLHEWGNGFCCERAKRLAQIKKDCKVDDDDNKCSGYGEDCETNLREKYDTVPYLVRSCADSCRSYKKWIGRKRIEYDKQKNAYGQQKNNYVNGNTETQSIKNDNGFRKIIVACSKAADFLEKLGPCKKDNENGEGPIKFDGHETFKHTKHCDPCSQFKVDCKNCNGGDTKGECNGKNNGSAYITANDIQKLGTSTEDIGMLVSDNSTTGFNGLDEACKNANIFKGIRKEQWKCGKVCGYNVCKPKNVSGKANGKNQIITIRGLIEHWVQNFLEDYNKIKHKISHCIKNSDGSTCQNKCNDKCNCASKWIDEKRTEWQKIRDRFKEQYKDHPDYNVKSVLEDLRDRPEFKNAIKPCTKFDNFERSSHCNGAASSESGKKRDIVECLLDKLQTKANKCAENPPTSDEEKNCGKHPPLVEDEDDEHIEEDENTVEAPKICKDVIKETAEEKEDGTCDAPVDPSRDEKPKEEDGVPAAGGGKGTEKAKPPPAPAAPPPPPVHPNLPADEPFNRDILEKTIPFGIALALGSIAFLFLKKKPQSPVDLIRVLDIHKGDYGIPTMKSKNRYIPYASDRYKGKTYIYMEGDSSGDEKYAFMSDTTDVTSSESEYEELDINDIYVPGSPKYKTLIEVVLEPSKSNGNTPSKGDGNTLGDDMVPTTNTFTDEEWNELKHDFISQYVVSEPLNVPKVGVSTELPMNIVGNVFGDKMDEKPFITSIHDRDLYTGEEISYNIHMSTNSMDDPKYVSNNVYSVVTKILIYMMKC
ncbi:hypothetical protein C923_03705 [Plasmodium falciparum UGT5.1]|uniref:Duffy-binding-like domain-containing protein n=1 Tax=Plasmodium falciparum UGT5.1 TaxID=1237627 RepID=W7JL91_PLAFA|nr:hypothetical protein C923_03705 [Plasmodium falciparum UGT5.1]